MGTRHLRRSTKSATSSRAFATTLFIGLFVVAVLATLSTLVTRSDVRRQTQEASALASLGDQVVAGLKLERAIENGEVDRLDIEAMDRAINDLIDGDSAANLPPAPAPAQASLETARQAVNEMLEDPTPDGPDAALYRVAVSETLDAYSSAASARSDSVQLKQLVLLGAMLALLLSEGVFLVRPLVNRVRDDIKRRDQAVADTRDRVDYLKAFDPLTGLANRSMATKRLQSAVSRAQVEGGLVTVLLFNIDDFRLVNDRHGSEAGDALLVAVGKRIKSVVRDSDLVARLGNDEFAVILEGGHRVEDAGSIADKILNALTSPYSIGDHSIFTTSSCGIVIYPLDGDDVEGLLRDAGIALAAAKGAGRNTYQFFTSELRERTSERLNLIDGLRRALERPDELRLVYQPKVDLSTNEVIGVEALIRWEHPDLGTILPGRFIPLAEETDLIIPLGKWVLHEALGQARTWEDRGVNISINVSSRQFRHGDLVETVREALETFGVPPDRLEVELTEGTLIEDVEVARATLEELKEMGVKVSIDDFGTGYSSLSYLKRFPIDTLKIDRSFIDEITTDSDDAAISKAIVSLARSLRMQVIAEGVETQDQLAYLRDLGCDAVQGFVFSRPLPPTEVERLVPSPNRQAS